MTCSRFSPEACDFGARIRISNYEEFRAFNIRTYDKKSLKLVITLVVVVVCSIFSLECRIGHIETLIIV